MRELTNDTPKPLLLVHHVPLIYYSLFLANKWGMTEATVNVHHLKEKFSGEFEKFSLFPIHVSEEIPEILGTAGGLRTAIERFGSLNDEYLIINPDFILLPEKDFNPWPSDEEREKFDCILYLGLLSNKDNYTGLSLSDGKVNFLQTGKYFYLGLAWIRASILSDLEVNRSYDLADIFRELSAKSKLGGKVFPGEFIDLGEKEPYLLHKDTDFGIQYGPEWTAYLDITGKTPGANS
ncbi:sugar-phosphate nucleotidyltransferase [Leptospira perolatii]|uniref:Sugar-phosphate nucleotidyltransferase n=2 Tax=Leptospira perolatii TaxID=2023191 RepID=A0A2M9ZTC5_9LEPT|nr:sugar-phosphate nucleotidyltransferase [Leptospira perolatii]PJZ75229.1 sugar-phosphate nucleotidyltransferase [Leptospira perolatii]